MSTVLASLAKAFGQLADRAVLAVLVKSVLLTVLAFAGFGVLLYAGLVYGFAAWGLSDGGLASAAAAAVIAGIAAWFLFRIIALAVLQFFADEIVAAVEIAHYPDRAQTARSLPFRQDLANSLRGMGRALLVNAMALPVALVLTLTGIGPALVFLAVNAWLLGRELTDMAWLRHCGDAPDANPVPVSQRALLGGLVAGLMLVPGLNLLAPVIGAAAGTHLTQSTLLRGQEDDDDD